MNRVLLTLMAAALFVAGCSQGSDGITNTSERLVGPEWPLLLSDVEAGTPQPLVVGEVLITNPFSSDARVELLSKNCFCFDFSGIPEVLPPRKSALITVFNKPNRSASSRIARADIKFECQGSMHTIAIEQVVRVLPDLQMRPSSLTVDCDSIQADKQFTIALNYRSRRQRQIDAPRILDPLPFASLTIDGEASHRRVNHDIWEVVWDGRMVMDRLVARGVANSKGGDQVVWVDWGFPEGVGVTSTLRIPIGIRGDRDVISLHPNTIYLDGASQVVAIHSPSGDRFSKVAIIDGHARPFDVRLTDGESRLQEIHVSRLPGKCDPGTYQCRLEFGSESGIRRAELEVNIPSSTPAAEDMR